MRRALLSLALACALAARAGAQDLSAVLVATPAEAAIGEPVEWTLDVEHPVRSRIELAGEDPLASLPELDRLSWTILSGPVRQVEDLGGGRARTRFRWQALSLESGERALPEIKVHDESGTSVTASGGKLEVWSDLAKEEDAPREMAGLHDVETHEALIGPFQVLVGLVALAVIAALAWWWRRRRGRARAVALPTPAERLAALRAAIPETPAAIRELAFELGQLLRFAAQERVGRDLASQADEELLALARPLLSAESLAELDGLLAVLSRVKFAGEVPTRFRVEELCAAASALLAKLEAEARAVPAKEAAA
jgi:hypothetical protein